MAHPPDKPRSGQIPCCLPMPIAQFFLVCCPLSCRYRSLISFLVVLFGNDVRVALKEVLHSPRKALHRLDPFCFFYAWNLIILWNAIFMLPNSATFLYDPFDRKLFVKFPMVFQGYVFYESAYILHVAKLPLNWFQVNLYFPSSILANLLNLPRNSLSFISSSSSPRPLKTLFSPSSSFSCFRSHSRNSGSCRSSKMLSRRTSIGFFRVCPLPNCCPETWKSLLT